jgi:hypothetical protein
MIVRAITLRCFSQIAVTLLQLVEARVRTQVIQPNLSIEENDIEFNDNYCRSLPNPKSQFSNKKPQPAITRGLRFSFGEIRRKFG